MVHKRIQASRPNHCSCSPVCRPAAKDALDAETQLLGVPAHVPRGPSTDGNRFYIVELAETLPHGRCVVKQSVFVGWWAAVEGTGCWC